MLIANLVQVEKNLLSIIITIIFIKSWVHFGPFTLVSGTLLCWLTLIMTTTARSI